MQHFFITGTPRSRTSWLANLFTHGNTFCLHDALKDGLDAEQVRDEFGRIAVEQPGLTHIGDSDSAILFMPEVFQELFPGAKWLLVKRDITEACHSFHKHFKDYNPYAAPGENWTLEQTLKLGKVVEEKYQRAKKVLECYTEISISALDDPVKVEEIWNWLVPGEPFNRRRWKLLDTLQVNPFARKTIMNLNSKQEGK